MVKKSKFQVATYTAEETYNLLTDLIFGRTKRLSPKIYQLMAIWLSGWMNSSSFSRLKECCGGKIDPYNFEANTPKYQELVHLLLFHLMSEREKKRVVNGKEIIIKTGLKNKLKSVEEFDYNNLEIYKSGKDSAYRQCIEYVKRAIRFALNKCLNTIYSSKTVNKPSTTSKQKHEQIQVLLKYMESSHDKYITQSETIQDLYSLGVTDSAMYAYRTRYTRNGEDTNYLSLESNAFGAESNLKPLFENSDSARGEIYEEITKLLHSNILNMEERYLIMAKFKMPMMVEDFSGNKVEISIDYDLFFSVFPQYCELFKSKKDIIRGSKKGTVRTIDEKLIERSDLYRGAIEKIKPHLSQFITNSTKFNDSSLMDFESSEEDDLTELGELYGAEQD